MIFPDFSFEMPLWEKGYTYIIGVDEVGRGAFAGPVVSGAATCKPHVLQKDILTLGINDSKKLSIRQRERLGLVITDYFYIGIGEASVGEINTSGIVKATQKAMRRAIDQIYSVLDPIFCDARLPSISRARRCASKKGIFAQNIFLLLDAFPLPHVSGIGLKNQKAITGGDAKSISIAAASIMAKLYRDSLMKDLHTQYTQYGWDKNKGYGTKIHVEGIKEFGLCEQHRATFVDHLDNIVQ